MLEEEAELVVGAVGMWQVLPHCLPVAPLQEALYILFIFIYI